MDEIKIIEVKESVFADNNADADRLRGELKESKTFLLNLMSSPGAGKTSTLKQLAKELEGKLRWAVMEADIDSAVDTEAMLNAGIPAIQIHTGGMCHLDADMTRQGLRALDTKDVDLVILENVGNLVCPAEFDTGAVKNMTILSVPEGHDKPLKYPLMYETCQLMVINKIDAAEFFDFDIAKATEYAKMRNPDIDVICISAKTGEGIPAPTTIEGTSVQLDIDQAKAFNFMIDDIDRAQSVDGLMETLIKEVTAKMAKTRDSFIANLAQNAENMSPSTSVTTPEAAKKMVDDALLMLREHDVDIEDEVTITVSPFFYQLFRDALTEIKTNNDELIKKGVVGMYDNCKVKLSNNLYNDGTDDYMIVRTKRAIAFVGSIDETEAYRPENHFADAVKGLNVYGGKIVRQNELYVIKAHK